MTPYSPEMQQLFKLLSDGEWADFREIKERLALSVGPGKALRKYQERIERRRERNSGQPMPKEPAEDEKIRFGQRLIADGVIQTAKRTYLDVEQNGGGFGSKHIRLRPGVRIPNVQQDGVVEAAESDEKPSDAEPDPEAPQEPVEGSSRVRGPSSSGWPPADRYTAPVGRTTRTEFPASRPFLDDASRVLSKDAEELARGMAEDDKAAGEMALFSEKQVRALVAQEVAAALDGFQRGFQSWLATELADMQNSACVLRQLHGLPKP